MIHYTSSGRRMKRKPPIQYGIYGGENLRHLPTFILDNGIKIEAIVLVPNSIKDIGLVNRYIELRNAHTAAVMKCFTLYTIFGWRNRSREREALRSETEAAEKKADEILSEIRRMERCES